MPRPFCRFYRVKADLRENLGNAGSGVSPRNVLATVFVIHQHWRRIWKISGQMGCRSGPFAYHRGRLELASELYRVETRWARIYCDGQWAMSNNGHSRVFRHGGNFADQRIVRANGASTYDSDGREILDFTSGQMSGIIGHRHSDTRARVTGLDNTHVLSHIGFLA